MMHQYIGARYVPIFYQNSLDPTSTEWESNVTYEPMTWVSLSNGNMYLSKKTVPANIGTPASNPEYWMEAGQFNAYINSLQNQINDMNDGSVTGSLQNQIDSIDTSLTTLSNNVLADEAIINTYNYFRNKKILLLGDSNSDTNESDFAPNWTTYFKTIVESLGATFTNNSASGRTFSAVGSANLPAVLPNITSGDYTDIILFLGVNDWQLDATPDQMRQAIETFTNWHNQYFVDAKVHIITPLKTLQSRNADMPLDYYRGHLLKMGQKKGFNIIDAYGSAPFFNGNITFNSDRYSGRNGQSGDGIHIRSTYAPIFAQYVFRNMPNLSCAATYVDTTGFTNKASQVSGITWDLYYASTGQIDIVFRLPSSYVPSGTITQLLDVSDVPDWMKPYWPVTQSQYVNSTTDCDVVMNSNGATYLKVNNTNTFSMDRLHIAYRCDPLART